MATLIMSFMVYSYRFLIAQDDLRANDDSLNALKNEVEAAKTATTSTSSPARISYGLRSSGRLQKFPSRQRLERHQYSEHRDTMPEGFAPPEFKCTYCESTFTREDSRSKHEKGCRENPDSKPRVRKKNVKRGTRVNNFSLGAQPPVTGLKKYLQLTELGAPQLPRLDLNSPIIFRGELYCRYPGCCVTTHHRQPVGLWAHYKIKHGIEYTKFKTAIGKIGREQHEAYTANFAKPDFKCPHCEGNHQHTEHLETMPVDSRNRHQKGYKENPDGQQRERKKNVKGAPE
ncbi:Zinc finger, C2H2 [Penicillium expansum]|nr:Zinc finger, C2H2 [Penicillium expansum]